MIWKGGETWRQRALGRGRFGMGVLERGRLRMSQIWRLRRDVGDSEGMWETLRGGGVTQEGVDFKGGRFKGGALKGGGDSKWGRPGIEGDPEERNSEGGCN